MDIEGAEMDALLGAEQLVSDRSQSMCDSVKNGERVTMQLTKLKNGVSIPTIGLGVFRSSDGEETENAVRWALEAGYRHIDTATAYGNEGSVGKAIKESGVKREDIFITTKLRNDDNTAGRTREAFEESLRFLDTDYVDLYLIHWPVAGSIEAWKEMEKLYDEGLIKAIGVSNFHRAHLEKLDTFANYEPVLDQIESNPSFNNQELVGYLQGRGIVAEAWSPLGGKHNEIREDTALQKIAAKYKKSPVQVIIRWIIQRGMVVLPKSVHKERIEANLDVFDFVLDDEDMKSLFSLDKNERVGSNPDDKFGF